MTTIIRFQRDDAPVSFIHITAKQFLATLSENREFSNILLKPSKAHTEIFTACLMLINKAVKFWIKLPTGYLSAHERDQRFLAIKEVPFLEYSLRHWYPHLKHVKILVKLWNNRLEGFRYFDLILRGSRQHIQLSDACKPRETNGIPNGLAHTASEWP